MIKKFHAQTTRDALRQVRDALGASALILSNRQVGRRRRDHRRGGYGYGGAGRSRPNRPLWKTQPPPRPQAAPAAPPPMIQPGPEAAAAAPTMRSGLTLDEAKPQLTKLADYLAERDVSSLIRPSPSRGGGSAAPPQAQPAPVVQPPSQPAGKVEPTAPAHAVGADAVDELAKEMRLLRGMVEGQLAGFAWNDLTRRDPVRMEAMKRLLAAGFSAAFARMLLERLPAG
jgi:flagellar biosynthesis protein FlhF